MSDNGSPRRRGPWLNLLLFAATIATTLMAGLAAFPAPTEEAWLAGGLTYMASLLGILLAHEMGHYLLGRRNAVPVSLPYFIPFPFNLFGTMGAVIVMRGRIRSRNALMEVGAAGPLAGVALAIPLMLIGLSRSPVVPLPEAAIFEGQSLLYLLLKRIAVGPIPEGYDVMLHPMAWAAWIGLLVTAINLIPIGQLDGGHVAYALWGERWPRYARWFHLGLFALGLGVSLHGAAGASAEGLVGDAWLTRALGGVPWVVLGVLLLVFGRLSKRGLRHPPTDDERLDPFHRRVGWLCVALFVATFTPVPLTIAS